MKIEQNPGRSASAGAYNGRRLFEPSAYHFTVTGSNDEVYAALKDRINLDDPLESLMLEKPMNGNQHGGEYEIGYGISYVGDPAPDYKYYDLMLQWILQGAQQ